MFTLRVHEKQDAGFYFNKICTQCILILRIRSFILVGIGSKSERPENVVKGLDKLT